MSIIIRLQNLPLSAKSEDIRRFFGGLRIPEGGVHIIGGEKGDAFIAFNSDEDARLAMRKDGGKLHDSRVKLYLSSYMEMHHEIDRLTKSSYSDSPLEYRWNSSDHKSPNRGRSPVHSRERDAVYKDVSESFSSRGRRSRSPKSRQPTSPFDTSHTKPRTVAMRKSRSISPRNKRFIHKPDVNTDPNILMHQSIEKNLAFINSNPGELMKLQQFQLEQKIAEAMTLVPEFANQITNAMSNRSSGVSNILSNIPQDGNFSLVHQVPFTNSPLPVNNNEISQQPIPLFSPVMQQNVSSYPGNVLAAPINFGPPQINPSSHQHGFYVLLSGLEPNWGFADIQSMLFGMFVPNTNIKFEIVGNGLRTGNVIVQLANKEDYLLLIANATYVYNNKIITVKECPPNLYQQYFLPDLNKLTDQCYQYVKMKNLPYTVTFEEIINFFDMFIISDIYIVADPNGKRDGTAFVSFENVSQYKGALKYGGKLIGPRRIGVSPSNKEEVSAMKRKNNALLNQLLSESDSNVLQDNSRRSLCAAITGLPPIMNISKLRRFFKEHGLEPDAIHLLLNEKKKSIGRAYVEFSNFRDFEAALTLHGSIFWDNQITIKQILYGEMSLALKTQKGMHFIAPIKSDEPPPVPEKVPHIWEPPDSDKHDNIPVSNLHFEDRSFFPENINIANGSNVNFMSNDNNVLQKQQEAMDFLHFSSHASPSYPMNEVIKDNYEDPSRIPLKFEVKNKNININIDEAFLAHDKLEVKRRLTRLTPEKQMQVSPKNNTSKSEKRSSDIRVKEKPKSEISKEGNENRDDKAPRKSSTVVRKSSALPKDKHHEKDEASIHPQRGKDRKSSIYPKSRLSQRYHSRRSRSPEFFRSRSSRSPERYRKRSPRSREKIVLKEQTVQISGVNPLITTQDLEEFFCGFKFLKDSFIRRFDNGQPTGDVRVSFNSVQEAEKAISFLNGTFVMGHPIEMFIV